MAFVRPSPSWEAPAGTIHQPMLDPQWRPVVGEKRCRFMADRKSCGAPSVAEMNRQRYSHRDCRYVESWWPYCPDHLYGRWLEGGQVWCWIVVPAGGKEG